MAVRGHGTLIAWEADPSGAPGVFTTIGELGMDIEIPSTGYAEDEVTCHNHTMDRWIRGGVINRSQLTAGVYFVHDDATHDATTGLRSASFTGATHGFRIWGPSGAAGVDEVIASGFVQNFGPIRSPVRNGPRSADFAVRFSGVMKVDGVIKGT